jgi:hypothetical protein
MILIHLVLIMIIPIIVIIVSNSMIIFNIRKSKFKHDDLTKSNCCNKKQKIKSKLKRSQLPNFYIYCLSGSVFRKQLKYSSDYFLFCLSYLNFNFIYFKLIMENQMLKELKISS